MDWIGPRPVQGACAVPLHLDNHDLIKVVRQPKLWVISHGLLMIEKEFAAKAEADTEEIGVGALCEQKVLVISETDPRLTWPERELVRQLGDKLYGYAKEAQHGRLDP